MPRKRFWKKSDAKKELRTDKTEETGLMKNSNAIFDLDLTEETGLFKNSKTISDIRMTEETGLVQNSKTNIDPEEPALRLQKNRKTLNTCSKLCDMNLLNDSGDMNLLNDSAVMNFLNDSAELNFFNDSAEMNLLNDSAELNIKDKIANKAQNEPLNNALALSVKSAKNREIEHQVHTRKLMFGSFHQGDDSFSPFSRGSQCTCIALTMLLKSYEGFSFTTEFIDSTLIAGDMLYGVTLKRLQAKGKFLNKLLQFDELPMNVTLGDNHHVIKKYDLIWGLAVSDENNQVQTLHQSLDEAFKLSKYLLIMLGAICSALYKVSDNEYYFFDSHSHDSDGMSCCDGKSVLVLNKSIDDTVLFMYNMYISMHIDLTTQFEILPVSISTLCHSFPDKDPLQKQYCRLDENVSSMFISGNEDGSRKEYMRKYMQEKRKNDQFRQAEQTKNKLARTLKRQNIEVKEKERQMNTYTRKLKRQNVEVKEKERQMDTNARKLKRQNVEVKEKERQMDTNARKFKRQNVEVKEKERQMDTNARKFKRQNLEVKEKERQMDTNARKFKRQNVEVKEKERQMDTNARKFKRQNVEVKEKERQMDTNARKFKRQNLEVKEKERQMDKKARLLKRQNVEVKEKEKQMDTNARKFKRQNVEVKEKERQMNTNARKLKRQNVEVKEKERQMDTNARKFKRQNVEVREKEQVQERVYKKRCREDPSFLEAERLKKQAKRCNNFYKQTEKVCSRDSKQQRRSDKDYCEMENERQRRGRFGITIEDCIRKFHGHIQLGPVYICSCCQQTWFKESVLKVENSSLDERQKTKFLTHSLSVENSEWICNTCYSSIKEDKIPKLSVLNGMKWPCKPKELELFPLEERLVSLRIPFMQIRELPRGGQYSVKGNIVNVPVDIQPTVNSLPRKLDENVTVPVRLKKRLSYQKCDYHENVRPTKVLMALHWLMNNSDFYKNANITVDDTWFHEITTSANEIVQELVGIQKSCLNNQSTEHDDSDDSDGFCEVHDVTTEGNCDTLLDDTSRDMNQVYTFAPGEGQRPLSLYQDETAEYLSFPTIFCGKRRFQDDKGIVHVSYADIAKWELRSVDRRAAQSVPNLFFKLKKIQIKQVTDKCNLALRKCKTKGKIFTASDIKNPEHVNNLVRHNEGYFVFRQLRNSPAYLETRKKDVFAMIRQLGLPTWFMSLSAADTRWTDLIRALGILNDGKEYTDEEINDMTWFEKTKLVQKDPITCTRYFDHRFRMFMNIVLKSDHNPIGNVKDFFYRVEFQQRGSPHVHMIVWIENAPKYQENSEQEIVDFVDQYLKCELVENDDLTGLQVHKHSQTCKKRSQAVCRFGFPLPPLDKTLILEPLECEVDKYKKIYDEIQKKLNEMKNGCNLSYQELLSSVLKISEEDYIKCIRSSLRGPKVFLKRKPCDMRVNSYNSIVLDAWKANIDIQYILDPYACAMYIVSYISKSQRGMSNLLNRAAKEAREGNLDIKRQVRHIGNQFLNSVEVGAQEAAYLVLQMPLTKASRDVIFINTSPSDDRVILIKTDTELDKLTPNSTDVECSNVVKRYSKRPKQLENWCLADYVSQLDVVFPKENEKDDIEKEVNDDDHIDSDDESDNETDDSDLHFNDTSILLTLKNGIKIRRRKTPRVIRYVRFNKQTDAENHYREKLMLFLPWRDESVDLLSNADTFEKSFNLRKSILMHKIKEYEYNAEQLDAALQMATEDFSDAFDELAPNVQQGEAEDENEGSIESESYVQFNPERPIEQRQYDIGPEIGIQSTRQITEQSSVRLPDCEYLELLESLNLKQREFFNHVLHWVKTKRDPVYSFLSGGAGVGKSVLIRALYQSLHRYLCSTEGENPDDIRILLCAYTGKAAYNIGGSTIASAFHQKINQNQQGLHCDELNTFRTKYRNLKIIIIDEISMVGNRSLALIDSRLQLLTGIKKPFGGISIIAVGDFFQLKPVMDRWIFQDLNRDAQSLANNLWKEHFSIFELDEIMRQKDDLDFAQLLNRLRYNVLTADDMNVIQRCMITETDDNYPHHAPHLFTQNSKVDAYNNQLIEKLDGEKIIVNSVDAVTKDYSKELKQKLLRSLFNVDDVSKTANLMQNLILAVGMIYDISVNVDVSDGLTNGSSCKVQLVERRMEGISRPSIVWVKFFDSAVGKNTRKKYQHLFHSGISDDWTPIFEVQRSFVYNYNTFQRIQFPLRPSAGKTVHKAQGCTVDEIVIDLSQNKVRKTPHIHYVALSRVRSVNHLHILNFNEKALAMDEQVVEEMERLMKDAPLQLCYVPLYHIDLQHFKIAFNNCRSLHKHFPQIRNEPNILASDVIGFSETRLTSADVAENYQLQGYTPVFNHEERDSLNTRPYHGTALYVKNDHSITSISKFNNGFMEFIIANVHLHQIKSLQIVVVYKYPSCSLRNFKDCVENHLKPLIQNKRDLVFLGDFNYDLFAGHTEFLSFMETGFNCKQIVTKTTHDSGSKLDLIFTNISSYNTDVIEAYWSDHKMVYLAFEMTRY
ncbi:uncharacterized protein LOC144623788 [Crassostrea virginica]